MGAWTQEGGRQPWPPSGSAVPCQLGRGWMGRPEGPRRWRRWPTTSGGRCGRLSVLAWAEGRRGLLVSRTALSGRRPPGSLFQVIAALNTGFFELCSQGFFFFREFEIVSELKVKQITTRETTLRLLVGCLAVGGRAFPCSPAGRLLGWVWPGHPEPVRLRARPGSPPNPPCGEKLGLADRARGAGRWSRPDQRCGSCSRGELRLQTCPL